MDYRIQFWFISDQTGCPRFRIEAKNSDGKWYAIDTQCYSASEAKSIVEQIIAGEAEYVRVPSFYKLIFGKWAN